MDFFENSEIFKKSCTEALETNKNTINRIKVFKEELEDVCANLTENRKYLHTNVIVPLSSKAMIRGKLVHTNEVYVNLGDRWFVKTSCERALEICGRMTARCNKNIHEWERETNLLSSNSKVLDDLEVFPNETMKEIIEPYDEAYEMLWNEQHRRRVREFKKQEMNERYTDKELLNRQIQPRAVENQMRLDEKNETLEVDANFGRVSTNNVFDSEDVSKCDQNTGEVLSLNDEIACQKMRDMRLTGIVPFKHSKKIHRSSRKTSNDEIVSPNDIYGRFVQQSLSESITNDLSECDNLDKRKKKKAPSEYLQHYTKPLTVFLNLLSIFDNVYLRLLVADRVDNISIEAREAIILFSTVNNEPSRKKIESILFTVESSWRYYRETIHLMYDRVLMKTVV